jgi:hypothetical protein
MTQAGRVRAAAALAAALLAGCAGSLPRAGGSFYVVYTATPDPVPLNQLFRLDVAVYQEPSRSPAAANTEILVRGWMPEHEHGMNLIPEIRPLGSGRFAVEGMLFHMPGRWQLEVEVRRGTVAERVTFEIKLE